MDYKTFTYKELCELKRQGTKLDFSQITESQLSQLWLTELVGNDKIAELYGVPKSRVYTKRQAWGLTTNSGSGLLDILVEHGPKIMALAEMTTVHQIKAGVAQLSPSAELELLVWLAKKNGVTLPEMTA